ncbi:MAG TPA: MFS transporter [Conexibacter sp.]|jgi:cyanate permease
MQTPPADRAMLPVAAALSATAAWNLTAMGADADGLAHALGTGLGAVGLIGALLWLAHAISQLPAGWMIERYGTRAVGALAAAGMLACNLLSAIEPDAIALGATRLVAGFFCGTGAVCAVMVARGRTAVGQGLVGGATSAGAAAPLALVPALEPLLGWRAPFVLGAVPAALMLPALAAVHDVRAPLRAAHRAATGLRSLLADDVLLRLSALLAAQTVLSWTMGNWIVLLLDRDGRFSSVVAGLLGALVFAGGIVARPLGAWITASTRVSANVLIGACLLGGSAAVGVIAAGAPPWVLGLAIAGLGLTASMPWAVILHAAGVARPHDAAAGVGMVGSGGTLAACASIPLFGVAFDTGHETLALVCLAVLAACSVLVLPVVRAQEPTLSAATESSLAGLGSDRSASRP